MLWIFKKIWKVQNRRIFMWTKITSLLISHEFYFISISSKIPIKIFILLKIHALSFLFLWATKILNFFLLLIFFHSQPQLPHTLSLLSIFFFVCSICIILPVCSMPVLLLWNLLNSLKRNLIKIQQKKKVFCAEIEEKGTWKDKGSMRINWIDYFKIYDADFQFGVVVGKVIDWSLF